MYSLPEVGKAIWDWMAEEFTCCLSLIKSPPMEHEPPALPGPGSRFQFCHGEKSQSTAPRASPGCRHRKSGGFDGSGAPGSGGQRACGCPRGGLGERAGPALRGHRSGQDGRQCGDEAPGATAGPPIKEVRAWEAEDAKHHVQGGAFLDPAPSNPSVVPLVCTRP